MKNIWLTLYMLSILFPLASQDAQWEGWVDLMFTEEEWEMMAENLEESKRHYQELHSHSIDNGVFPALQLNIIPLGVSFGGSQQAIDWGLPESVALPEDREDLAFYTVAELATLLRTRQVSSVELTRLYLDRLRRWGDTLRCVVTLTEELALAQARRADEEIAAGNYRGPLHGIPYGVKDLLAVPGYPTTWGAMPFKDQTLSTTATVVQKLEAAGAVLLCKLSMGALAMGDVWYKDRTRNPWNLAQGSSGSSAGSGAATAAGLVAFAIGTETLGSIVSPSTRCGVSGLRPTYGRVSRYGAMALCWSMDKIGPMCRSATDCALVFNSIRGSDPRDPTLVDAPFNYQQSLDLSQLKVGYYQSAFEADHRGKEQDLQTLEVLKGMGAELIPFELPDSLPLRPLNIILAAEAAAAFDELTRSDRDSLLVRQDKQAWPNFFRSARTIPAVEYIQANRFRQLWIQKMHALMQAFDVVVTPTYGGSQLLLTNLTGHPCVVVPNGWDGKGSPTSISFLGKLFDEATILAVARAYQEETDFDEQHPPKFE